MCLSFALLLDLAQVWKQFDLNGDEIIKVHEVEKFLSKLRVTLPEAKRHELVKSLDKNNDGTISFIEFVHVYNDPDFRKYKCILNQ